MKSGSKIVQSALVAILVLAALVALVDTPAWAARNGGSVTQALTDAEAADLTYMREEEKLARDVYITMLGQYNAVIFSNISNSEQQHMDTMLKMLDKYNRPDPAEGQGIGVFTDEGLQAKFDELVATGSVSYIDALTVGATIEEIDMVDIQKAINGTTKVDLLTAYQNLLEGSKNHLRAYVSALAAQGVTYYPKFISEEFYVAIIGL